MNENVSDQMLCSVVFKVLPQQFANFVTVLKYPHELKSFPELTKTLLCFDSERNLKSMAQGSSLHFSKDVKCFKCGKFGRKLRTSKRNVGRKLLRSFVTNVRKVTWLMRVLKLKRRRLRNITGYYEKVFRKTERTQLDNRTQRYRRFFSRVR